jgi:hypothetical protein
VELTCMGSPCGLQGGDEPAGGSQLTPIFVLSGNSSNSSSPASYIPLLYLLDGQNLGPECRTGCSRRYLSCWATLRTAEPRSCQLIVFSSASAVWRLTVLPSQGRLT